MLRVAKGKRIKSGVLALAFLIGTCGNAACIYAEGETAEEGDQVYVEETWEETEGSAETETWQEEGVEAEAGEENWEEVAPAEETAGEDWETSDETWEEQSGESAEEFTGESAGESVEGIEDAAGDGAGEDSAEPATDGEDGTDGSKPANSSNASPNGEPQVTANGALVYCRTTGEIVYSKNIDTKFSPYSITKIVTALLAVQRLSPEQEVTISGAAASQGGASMYLQEGEVVTVENLLYGTMILSGNDAAYALGETVSGDMESFIKLMNETVESIGCKNTHFESPSGLIRDTTQHYTTAKDMLEIAKVAFSNNMLKEIAGTKKYEMSATEYSEARTMETHNELLNKPGYVAGKTGWWEDPDEATLVIDYENDGLEFLAVLLGDNSKDRTADCEKMISYANKVVEGITVVHKGENVGKVRVRHGEITTIDAFTSEDSKVYLPKQGSKELISTDIQISTDVEAPVKKDDQVGTYKVYIAGEQVDEVPLVAGETVDVGWFPSYVGISNRTTMMIVGGMGIVLILLLAWAVHKLKKKQRARAAHRQKIREMAEEELNRDRRRYRNR